MFRQVEDRFGQVCHTDLGRFMLESHRSLTSRVHLLRSPHHIYHAICPKPGGSRGSCANLAVFATGGRHGDYRAGRLEGCSAGGPQRDAVGFAGVVGGGLGYASKPGPGSRVPAKGLVKFAPPSGGEGEGWGRSMKNNHIFIRKRRGFEQTFEAHVVTQTLPVLTQLIAQISSWGQPPDRPAGPGRPDPLYRSHSGSKHPHRIGET